LGRFWRLKANALQSEHASLRFRAARGGEAADFAAGRQNPVTGMISGAGFLAIASPTSRAASRPAPTSFASAP
jgi:hypothetical protein